MASNEKPHTIRPLVIALGGYLHLDPNLFHQLIQRECLVMGIMLVQALRPHESNQYTGIRSQTWSW